VRSIRWEIEVETTDSPHPALASLAKPEAHAITARTRPSQRMANRLEGEGFIGSESLE
jgi:hypothetical protein